MQATDEPPQLQVSEYLTVDELGASFRTLQGLPEELKITRQVINTWGEIAAFSSYPLEGTTIEKTTVEVPAGTFDAILYTTHTGAGQPVIQAWFAKDMPGPPVKAVHHKLGEQFFSLKLQSYERGTPPAEP